jgi:hypothetical protein
MGIAVNYPLRVAAPLLDGAQFELDRESTLEPNFEFSTRVVPHPYL